MSMFQLAIFLIFVTSVLTLSDSETSKNNVNQPPALKRLFNLTAPEIIDPSSPTDTGSVGNNHEPGTVSKGDGAPLIVTEGGSEKSPPARITPDANTVSSKKGGVADESSTSRPNISRSDDRRKGSSIVPRKGVNLNKISARKGAPVDHASGIEGSESTDETLPPESVSTTDKVLAKIPVARTESTAPVIENDRRKSNANDTKSNERLDTAGNKTANVPYTIIVPGRRNNSTKHKPKPMLTTGEDGNDDDKGLPSSPTQTQIGMPKKIDYIIPVVITIMAAPILGIATYILYTRGRDCWDKRHYRRMDFLIDGMYND